MELRDVVAIIPTYSLESVEKRLQEIGVRGITVTRAKGYGEHPNFFAPDWLNDQVKIDIFADRERAEAIAAAILEAAHPGSSGGGIVAIRPVEKVYSIRSRLEIIPNQVRS